MEGFYRRSTTGGRQAGKAGGLAPTCVISIEELVCFLRSAAARGISRESSRGMLVPVFEYRVDDGPCHFHFVAAGEKRWISDHAIEQQGLVRRVGIVSERFGV